MWNLLAQVGRDGGMHWPSQSVIPVIIAVAIIGLALLGYRLVRYFLNAVSTGRPDDSGSRALLKTLARQHRLTAEEERELVRIASRLGLERPTMLFVRRSMLEHESARCPGPELNTLVRKLFD